MQSKDKDLNEKMKVGEAILCEILTKMIKCELYGNKK